MRCGAAKRHGIEVVPLCRTIAVVFLTILLTLSRLALSAENQPLTVDQLVEIAVEENPQIKVAKEQWDAEQHQILQNYAPADPVFTYGNVDSSKDFNAAPHSHAVSENFQFPGEALLQADEARRTAESARLTYQAAIRDLRASVETAYYQVLLDEGLIAINAEKHRQPEASRSSNPGPIHGRPGGPIRSRWRRVSSRAGSVAAAPVPNQPRERPRGTEPVTRS